MFNNKLPVLLLTGTDLDRDSIGALYLNDLMKVVSDRVSFKCMVLEPFLLAKSKRTRVFRLLVSVLSRISLFQWVRIQLFRSYSLNGKVESIIKKITACGADFVWVTLSTPELILIAERLVDKGVRVKVTVWDAPEYLVGNLKLPLSMRKAIFRSFGHVLNHSDNGMVPSFCMKEQYFKQYGLHSIVIRHGAEDSDLYLSGVNVDVDRESSSVSVIFAGSLYSKKEWNAFISALDSCNWTVAGKNVEVHYVGDFPVIGAVKSPRVTYYGRKSYRETQKLMQTIDIGYVPYWLSEEYEIVAKTSFPGKMSAYTAAGLAIFHHGPSYSEVTSFLKKYPYGVSCDSLKAEEILKSLGQLIKEAPSNKYKESNRLAFKEELSSVANRNKFEAFLGL